jgi:hypothetical protein
MSVLEVKSWLSCIDLLPSRTAEPNEIPSLPRAQVLRPDPAFASSAPDSCAKDSRALLAPDHIAPRPPTPIAAGRPEPAMAASISTSRSSKPGLPAYYDQTYEFLKSCGLRDYGQGSAINYPARTIVAPAL